MARPGPNPKLGEGLGHVKKVARTAARGTARLAEPRPLPPRRDGRSKWAPIVAEFWERACLSVAAGSVYDEVAWSLLENAAYQYQIWWEFVAEGKGADATRAYSELRQQLSMLYLPPPDRIRAQREGTLPETVEPQTMPSTRSSARSRARLQAVAE